MKKLVALGSIACLISLQAYADCVVPEPVPSAPDGATASRDDMVSAQKAFRSYDAAVKEYTTCLEKTVGAELRQNMAVEKLHIVADKFNAELRTFKKRTTA